MSQGSRPGGGSAPPREHRQSSQAARHDAVGTDSRSLETEVRQDLERINEWVSDESVTPEIAAKNLWALAADPSRPATVRNEALAHAMNLTDDETFGSIVIPMLRRKGVFTDEMSEKILDDLYNRPPALKLEGTLALFENSSGELHTNVRELLVFELGDPVPDDISDPELIRLATEKMKAPVEP